MIPLARPEIGEDEVQRSRRVLRSGWLTQGPEVAAFEADFAAAVGAPNACAVSNCTAALHLALLAVGVGPGDEVVTVSHSFIATANAIHMCGAEPVFADIEPETCNIDPVSVSRLIGPRTTAILCVHQMGMPCDMASLVPLARAHGLRLVEDAACASGSEIAVDGVWHRIGAPLSDAACFSFHPRKVITTGEGGMITTADPAIDARLRLLRQHGMSVSDVVRHTARTVVLERYDEPGFNYRMTDMQAALGRQQLKRLPRIVAERRALAARYDTLLGGLPGVAPPTEPAWARSNWQSYCVGLPPGAAQHQVMQAMLERGVATRRAIMSSHRERSWQGARHAGLTVSDSVSAGRIILPLFSGMTPAEQGNVVEALAASLYAKAA